MQKATLSEKAKKLFASEKLALYFLAPFTHGFHSYNEK